MAPEAMLAESDALHGRVQRFARASLSGGAHEGFDTLALDIARFQARHVAPVGRLCAARGVDLGAAREAGSIPAVPTDVFRLVRVAAHPPDLDVRVFATSGTTAGARGRHALRTTATYELVALAWGRTHLLVAPPPQRAIVLAPAPERAADSSLGFMIELFARAVGGAASWHVGEAGVDVASVARACADARAAGEPTLVLGTSFAFVHLADARGDRDLSLPAGSRAMQTGGFKGRSRQLDPEAMRTLVARLFGLSEEAVVGEYGMTELSSQLYEETLRRRGGPAARGVYQPPPWLRVVAVDAATLEPLPAGVVGLGRFVDLANVDSAVAIQTADRVRVSTGGGVELFGREPGATPRGCSLAVEEITAGGAGSADPVSTDAPHREPSP